MTRSKKNQCEFLAKVQELVRTIPEDAFDGISWNGYGNWPERLAAVSVRANVPPQDVVRLLDADVSPVVQKLGPKGMANRIRSYAEGSLSFPKLRLP